MRDSASSDHHSRALPLAALIAGNIALALGPWLVRLADSGPVSAGFWRLALAVPFLALIARANAQPLAGLPRKTLAVVLLGGVLFGLDIASWHTGIGMTRLANATLFGNSGSIILMIWGFVMLRRVPQGREWWALLAAGGGTAILLGRSLEVSSSTFAGDLFCILAGMFYAAYLLILQDARKALGGWALLTWSSIASAALLLPIALALGEAVWPTNWAPLVILAASSQIFGQGLLVYALRHFPPLMIGIGLLTQPAVAALVGWLAFDETLAPLDLMGVALVASALVLARVAQGKVAAAPKSQTPAP